VPPSYRFRAEWTVPAGRDALVARLADVAAYPVWWPQVRVAEPLDDERVRVVCRSLLPYGLDLVLTRRREDRAGGLLEAAIGGDLDGWSRWTLRACVGGTRVRYDQEVMVTDRLLAAASRRARPVFVANHAWMMRGARRGLAQTVPRAGR
jgi:hypothetical protein